MHWPALIVPVAIAVVQALAAGQLVPVFGHPVIMDGGIVVWFICDRDHDHTHLDGGAFSTELATVSGAVGPVGIDFPSIPKSSSLNVMVVAPRFEPDRPLACSYPQNLDANLVPSCLVTDAGMITFRLGNPTNSPINPGPGNYGARIF